MPKYTEDNTTPIERKIVNIKEGDKFKLNGHTFEVIKVYSHYARCIREDGFYESFTIGDFVIMGLEDKVPNETNCNELR